MKNASLWQKDFGLVVIGQIISLFGNAILRFALPLYLLDQTGSPALLGLVSAVSFVPMILFTPVGGIIADRVNKRNIMVILDFGTAAIVLLTALALGKLALVPLLVAALMLLYAIQGAYQPAVQASMPILAPAKQLTAANAIINMVSSLASLIGPVLGGLLYGWAGLMPILYASCACFFCSAALEIFIVIPHQRQDKGRGVLRTAIDDLRASLRFIFGERPVLGKVVWLISAFNLFMSAMLIIGLQVILRQTLAVSTVAYGFAQGALAAGGLVGGLCAGLLGAKLRLNAASHLLLGCALGTLPMALTLIMGLPASISYAVIVVFSFLLMLLSTLFSVQMLSYVQAQTPVHLVGKVVACLLAVSMCAQPVGQALYGLLFERFAAQAGYVVLFAALVSGVIALCSRAAFRAVEPRPVSQA